jgi:uncharacterized membrane protein YvbJ
MLCTNCGSDNPVDAVFSNQCGYVPGMRDVALRKSELARVGGCSSMKPITSFSLG